MDSTTTSERSGPTRGHSLPHAARSPRPAHPSCAPPAPAPLLPSKPLPTCRSWAAALDRLKRSPEWHPRRNQLALLGCGAYGLPLARFAKGRNVSAIYVGGLLPLLFGVHGRRQRTSREYAPRINAHWAAPRADETPSGTEHLVGEPGAYW